ncbi:MAG: hypothetical protein OHK93_007153 [Ramalina farinacea]|uniref:Small ribosomal subunit protein mS33 n=1 Tax=Ramalina farinacea TaxID=258253 RepID=A0AA43QP74_9LECA|nr:hypothetical protein [Ramalina farinacea]
MPPSPPPPSRLHALLAVQCRIFSHTYNPHRLRQGTSVLRQRLRGPATAAYYPRRVTGIKSLLRGMRKVDAGADIDTWDEKEEDRIDHLNAAKARGKGAPRKKRSADESKKIKSKKPKPAPAAAAGGLKF